MERFGRHPPRVSTLSVPGQLHHGCRSARRIDAAVRPGVTVISDDDELIGPLASPNHAGHRPDRPHSIVGADTHVHHERSSAEPIRQRQCASPFRRRLGTTDRLEEHAGVLPRERSADDRGQGSSFRSIDAGRGRGRGPSWRQRIARHEEVVHDAATLNVARRPPRSLGVDASFGKPVVGRIRIDEEASRAALLGGQCLESSVAVRHRIADESDGALDRDSDRLQTVVVFRIAASGIHNRCGDVAGGGVGVIGEPQLLRRRLGIDIAGHRLLTHRGAPCMRRHHFNRRLFRPRQQNVIRRHRHRFEPEGGELIPNVVGQLAVARRSRDVWSR